MDPDCLFFHPNYEETNDFLYYVEYNTTLNTWRMFKRNWITKEAEGHPYQLANGPIQPNVIGMNNPNFLNFMIDSLNLNSRA
jgi:hypothetical protein